jgi:hypothetical protein
MLVNCDGGARKSGLVCMYVFNESNGKSTKSTIIPLRPPATTVDAHDGFGVDDVMTRVNRLFAASKNMRRELSGVA